jgi:hypothetical protein
MTGFKRSLKMILPVVLLLAAAGIYLGEVKPAVRVNEQHGASLAGRIAVFESLLNGQGFYPSPELIDELVRLEQETGSEMRGLLAPAPEAEEMEKELKYILMQWGYALSNPVYLDTERFRVDAERAMGAEREESATRLARMLALSFAKAGIGRFEKLEVVETDQDPLAGSGPLRGFGVEIVINAGITEALQFVEDWILSSGGGLLVRPDKIVLKPLDPGQWLEDIKYYSGPPVRLELTATVLFIIDKGPS